MCWSSVKHATGNKKRVKCTLIYRYEYSLEVTAGTKLGGRTDGRKNGHIQKPHLVRV